MFGKREKKEDGDGNMFGAAIMSLLTGVLFGKVQEFFSGVFLSAKDATEAYVKHMIQKLIIGLSVVVGLLFILIGLAQVISYVYQKPGLGEIIVGGAILILSLVWSLIPGKKDE